eukprot:3004864-Alexandrium_andersonii.AAC.1
MAIMSKNTSCGGGGVRWEGENAPRPAGLQAGRPRRATPLHCRPRWHVAIGGGGRRQPVPPT